MSHDGRPEGDSLEGLHTHLERAREVMECMDVSGPVTSTVAPSISELKRWANSISPGDDEEALIGAFYEMVVSMSGAIQEQINFKKGPVVH